MYHLRHLYIHLFRGSLSPKSFSSRKCIDIYNVLYKYFNICEFVKNVSWMYIFQIKYLIECVNFSRTKVHIFLISKIGVRKPSSIKISSITSPTSHCMKVDGTRPHFYATTIQQLSHHVRIVMRHQLRLREVTFQPYILCIILEFWSFHSSLYYFERSLRVLYFTLLFRKSIV